MTPTVARNFGFIAASNVLAPLCSVALVLAIARLQGVAVLGKYSLLMSIFVFGASISSLGLPLVLTRETAKAHARSGPWFTAAVAVATALALPAVLLAVLACRLATADEALALALQLTVLAALPSVVTTCGEAVLLAHERARDFVAINLGETVLRALAGTALIASGFGLVAIAALLLALRVANAAAFLAMLRRRGVRPASRLDPVLVRRLARSVPVTGAIPIVNALFARADVFLLSALGTWQDVGLYGAALRLVDLGRTLTPAYARAVYPMLSRLRAGSSAAFAGAARRATREGLLIGAAVSLGLYAAADPLIALLFGSELAAAADVLRVLAWTVIPFAVGIVLAQVLFASDCQAVDLGVNVVGGCTMIAAGLLLIPAFGAVGAAGAALFAATVYVVLQYLGARRWAAPLRAGPDFALVAVASAGALAVHAALVWAGPVLATLGTLIAYPAMLVPLGLVPPLVLSWVRFGRRARDSEATP